MKAGASSQDSTTRRAESGRVASDTEVLLLEVLLVARTPNERFKKWIDMVLLKEQSYKKVRHDSRIALVHAFHSRALSPLALPCTCLQLGPDWPVPSAWSARGLVLKVVAEALTQELQVLGAAAGAMYEGRGSGQVEALLPATYLAYCVIPRFPVSVRAMLWHECRFLGFFWHDNCNVDYGKQHCLACLRQAPVRFARMNNKLQ
eukprot:1317631-Pleurochrysis_carterae.AAC.1